MYALGQERGGVVSCGTVRNTPPYPLEVSMRWMVVMAVLLCGSCKLHESVQAGVESTKRVIDDVQQVTAVVKTMAADIQRMRAEADTDGDGKTSGQEWLNYLLLGGGGTGLLGLLARNNASNKRKEKIEGEVAELRTVVAELKAKNGA